MLRLNVENFIDFEIIVDGKVHKVNLDDVCKIDMENLVEEFTKFPAVYAWYATVLGLYESKSDDMEYKLDKLEASLNKEARKKLMVEFGKGLKERQVECEVDLDGRYQVLKEEFMDVRLVVKKLRALVKALETKNTMLVQIGARARKQMDLDNFGR